MKRRTIFIVGLIVLLLAGMSMTGCSTTACHSRGGAVCHMSECNSDTCGYCVAVRSNSVVEGRCNCR